MRRAGLCVTLDTTEILQYFNVKMFYNHLLKFYSIPVVTLVASKLL